MGTPIGSYSLHKTSLDAEAGVLLTFDFGLRHEVAAGVLIASASMRVMQNDVASTDLTVTSVVVSADGTKVQGRLTDVASTTGEVYHLVCDVTLSDGTALVESITVSVEAA